MDKFVFDMVNKLNMSKHITYVLVKWLTRRLIDILQVYYKPYPIGCCEKWLPC